MLKCSTRRIRLHFKLYWFSRSVRLAVCVSHDLKYTLSAWFIDLSEFHFSQNEKKKQSGAALLLLRREMWSLVQLKTMCHSCWCDKYLVTRMASPKTTRSGRAEWSPRHTGVEHQHHHKSRTSAGSRDYCQMQIPVNGWPTISVCLGENNYLETISAKKKQFSQVHKAIEQLNNFEIHFKIALSH